MTTIEVCRDQTTWDDAVNTGDGHPLQLWGWGEVKAAHNWQVVRLLVKADDVTVGGAQVLFRRLPFPLKNLAYIPRGPVCAAADRSEVLAKVGEYVKHTYGSVALTIEPDWTDMPPLDGWRQSTNTILIPRTLILDLARSEDELLAAMSKKTRQYIRKSAGEAITVRKVEGREELADCLAIYKQTAARAGFALHDDQYYYDIYDCLGEHSLVMAAFQADKPIAFLWLVLSAETAFELYGGMNDLGQQLRANYTLKWQTIQLVRRWGVARYDMNGLLNDGVSTFKQGFADHEDMLVGTYDRPLSPLYPLWNTALPAAKKIIRKLKNR